MPNDDSQLKSASGGSAVTNCPNCGASISAESKFCSNCGSRTQQFPVFTESDTEPVASVADTPPPPAPSPSDTPPPASQADEPPLLSTAERRGVDATANSPTALRLKKELQDRYEIIRELGRGGMATVFLARDSKHGRNVAIKVLHPELSASIGGDRFEREIRVVAALQHPNILGLYDSGSADGLLYYVMPFVDGESLRDRIDREGQLPVDEAMRITLEVANALSYAHGKGIVHRDIKPENILLSGEMTLVADFGIARATSEANVQKLTQTGMAIGTPVYMAPEQAGGEAVGPSADIYSLGCMLYEMLAGEPPFTGKNPIAIMARHAMEQVPSIRIVRSAVPAEVEETIFAAMGKVPADRPQTAAQFAELLGMPLGSTTTMRVRGRTSTYSVIAPLQPWWKRKAVMAAIPVTLIAGAAGFYWYQANSAPPESVGFAPNRIAVLYFADQSPDGQLAHVADGLTEALIDELRQVRNLDVVSPNGVSPYRDPEITRDSVGRALQAGTLVDGSVEQSGGNSLRIQVRLIDGNTGTDLGQRASFVQPVANLLAIRDSLASRVAALVRERVGAEVKLQEQRNRTRNVAAWSLVQLAERSRKNARAAWRRGESPETARQFALADSVLHQAEELDPAWADPVIARGEIAFQQATMSHDRLEIARLTESGLRHAGRALAMDDKNAAALELRGALLYQRYLSQLATSSAEGQRLLADAERDLQAAVAQDPSRAYAWFVLSHMSYTRLDQVDAKLNARRAYEADAYLANTGSVLRILFRTSYGLEQWADAVQWCDEGYRRFPQALDFTECRLWLLTSRARDADVPQAWRLVDEMRRITPPELWELQGRAAHMFVAAVLARASLPDSARRVIQRARGNTEIDEAGALLELEAFARTLLGDHEEAIQLLKLYLTNNPEHREGLKRNQNWWWRPLQEDRRFRALLEN